MKCNVGCLCENTQTYGKVETYLFLFLTSSVDGGGCLSKVIKMCGNLVFHTGVAEGSGRLEC
jgi:hypothetical protein